MRLLGEEPRVALAAKVLEQLYACVQSGQQLVASDVREAVRTLDTAPETELKKVYGDVLRDVGGRRKLYAKNLAQRTYIDLIQKHDVVLAVGPAGTGKTYLAMAMAVAALNRREVSRLILVRPAVEAGEKLGFLPGDLVEIGPVPGRNRHIASLSGECQGDGLPDSGAAPGHQGLLTL